MRVDTQLNNVSTLDQVRRQQGKNTQSVFSEILIAAGREGYASAEIVESETPMPERIDEVWNQWYQTQQRVRFANAEAPQDQGTFGDVLQKAYQEGAYVDPITFLNGLSKEELTTVQNTHLLAEPIGVNSLTEEGALNLLIPPPAQVDLNRDGLTQTGAGFGIRFPDSTTPPEVAAAWDSATANLSVRDRMHYALQMKLPVLLSNVVTDSQGAVTHSRSPGDPEFVNPLGADDYSFVKVTQDWLDHLEFFKSQIDPLRYEKDRGFWSEFQKQLRTTGAA